MKNQNLIFFILSFVLLACSQFDEPKSPNQISEASLEQFDWGPYILGTEKSSETSLPLSNTESEHYNPFTFILTKNEYRRLNGKFVVPQVGIDTIQGKFVNLTKFPVDTTSNFSGHNFLTTTTKTNPKTFFYAEHSGKIMIVSSDEEVQERS